MDRNYRVILACRNDEKAARAGAEIVKATDNDQVVPMKLDTSSLSSVRAFACAYIRKYGSVDVLINNAGISPMRDSGLTEEGFEVVFATNYLGHFLLTQMLLFQNFPQFIVIHTVKGFGIVNKAEIDVFWNSLAFSMIQQMLAI